MCVRWACMRKEMSCNSSRSHGTGPAGAMRRSRSSRSVGCEKARYAHECPARAHHRSVWVRSGRVYGCRVLARGQKTIYADAGRVYGCGVRARRTESYRRRYNLEEEREQKDHNQLQLVPHWGLGMSRGDGECYGNAYIKES